MIPELGRFPGEGEGYPLQYSGLENSMDYHRELDMTEQLSLYQIWASLRSVGKESAYNAGDPGLIYGSGRSAGEGMGYPLQYSWASLEYSGLENSMDCIVHGVSKSWTRRRLSISW